MIPSNKYLVFIVLPDIKKICSSRVGNFLKFTDKAKINPISCYEGRWGTKKQTEQLGPFNIKAQIGHTNL